MDTAIEYSFGGFFVTQRLPRAGWMSAELLPAELVTASACIAKFVPDDWSIEWTNVGDEKRAEAAAALGIPRDVLPKLVRYVTDGLDRGLFGWPNVVTSEHAVGHLLSLLPPSQPWVVLGLALHQTYADRFLEEEAPQPGMAAGGLYESIAKRTPLPPNGVALGFEPLGFEYGGHPHSWLCNGLEKECFAALGIRPNAHGLIEAEHEAAQVAAHINRDDVGSEPVLWWPWKILDYTAHVQQRRPREDDWT